MRVVLVIAVVLLVGTSGAALIPPAEPIQRYLSGATLGLAILVLISFFLQKRENASPEKLVTEPARPALGQSETSRADAEIVQFLAMLQEKGRLVDFLMDDINAYNDAQVGAAARVVHVGCKSVLQEYFRINPIRSEQEGSAVQVPAGYSADEYRLIGRVAGSAPFSGVLVHRGWRTDMVKLPELIRRATDQLPSIAPAEVELE